MIISRLVLSTTLTLVLAACSAVQGQAPSLAGAPAEALAPTSAPEAGAIAAVFTAPTATAVALNTSEPAADQTAAATPEIDPYILARQIVGQVDFSADGWLVTPCEGEAAVLCISAGQRHVGYAELNIYPLSAYDADHALQRAAAALPPEPADYSGDEVALTRRALAELAGEHLAVIAADRAFTFPDDDFAPLEQQPAQMGVLPALSFGFAHTDEQGALQEQVVNVAAFDQRLLYWLGITYLRGNESDFASEADFEQFTPVLPELAAGLPIHMPPATSDNSPPLLPPLVTYWEQNAELPAGLTWELAADLPQSAETVDVLSQPAQGEPLTAEQAAAAAAAYGLNTPLYVEARPGLTVDQATQAGMFMVFDGSRSLALTSSRFYYYNDIANWYQGFDLPFVEAAPLAARFLKANGWLTFPYSVADSSQGEGVMFLPIIDDVQLLSPAYSVRVAGNGQVSSMSIYPLESLTPTQAYPIMTAEEAWAELQSEQQEAAVFYRYVPPVVEADPTAAQPLEFDTIPPAGGQVDVYTNIWAYRPLVGDGPPVISSSEFFHIRGDEHLLDELAGQSDYLVHLWGTVLEPHENLLELELTRWEVREDAGGLPMFFGLIERDGDETYLVDEANDVTYLLPDAPQELAGGEYAAVSGLPETDSDSSRLIWQRISVFPQQAETAPQPTAMPVQTVTVDTARLVYLNQPAGLSGLDENLFIPAWEFAGTADGGARVTVWVTAVRPDYFRS